MAEPVAAPDRRAAGHGSAPGPVRAGRRVIPGGVNSPVRAFRSVGGTPYFVARGEGAYVWDVEGNRYIDYVQSYGASILGHAHPEVVEAVRRAAAEGTSFGAPTEREVLLAEEICGRVAGCEQVRLVNSGTEAAMSAVRLARGATGRDRVVLFAGCYHGHSDGLLAGGGSGVATLGLPASAGVPKAAVAETLVVPYNVVPELGAGRGLRDRRAGGRQHGPGPPGAGLPRGPAPECDRAGALLIFDEVITGFRVGYGGAAGGLRRAAGPLVLRQGDRRRAAAGRLRRPPGRDGAAGAGRARLPGRHPVGQPAGHRRRPGGAGQLDDAGYTELAARVGRLRRRAGRRRPVLGARSRCRWPARWSGVFFGAAPVIDYDGAPVGGHRALPAA